LQDKSPLRFIPSSPRCRLCAAPFGRPGTFVLRRYGYTPWEKNPKICGRCFKGIETVAKMCPTSAEDAEINGAEVELSMLFADVRGSSKLARQMPTWEFTRLMNRFYKVSKDVLVEADAIIEKFVGDEVVALFLPLMTGPGHARRAVESAEALLDATGHADGEPPWVPLGAGVHTGVAFVGIVGTRGSSDFTALGDPVNIASHLASQAATGEVLVSEATAAAAAMTHDGLERRHVSLKGHPLDALVLRVGDSLGTGRSADG
jgi:adenylate cyclase